jgi:hypothetical protein
MTTINFYKSTGIIDYFIKLFSRGKYCHCNITINGITYEAIPFNKVRKFSLVVTDEIDSFSINLTPVQEQNLIKFYEKQLGKGYDYFSVIGFILYSNNRRKSGKWFCSELVASGLFKVGCNVLKRVPAFKLSPVILSYSPLI